MEIKKKADFLLVIFFLISLINFVYALAPPALPDHFMGELIIDDEDADIGTEIKVYVNNELVEIITTTAIGEYDLYVKLGNSGDEIKFKVNDIEADTYKRQGGKNIGLDLRIWTDRDKDGIRDDEDNLIGNKNDVDNNFDNLKILIDDDENFSGSFSGVKNVKFEDNNKEILVFEFDFDDKVLNLFNLEIKKQKQSDEEGSILIKGIPGGTVKTVYVDKLTGINNAVCIKDEDINDIDELSKECSKENEIKLNCPDSNGNYTCSVAVEEDRFKVSGLSHSGVKEFYIAPSGSNNQNNNAGGGSGGGGPSGGGSKSKACIENWECQNWFNCREDGIQKRICVDKNNCGTLMNKPLDIRECIYEEGGEKAETKEREGRGNKITGAFIGTKNKNILYGIGALLFVVLFLLCVILFKRRGGAEKQQI